MNGNVTAYVPSLARPRAGKAEPARHHRERSGTRSDSALRVCVRNAGAPAEHTSGKEKADSMKDKAKPYLAADGFS